LLRKDFAEDLRDECLMENPGVCNHNNCFEWAPVASYIALPDTTIQRFNMFFYSHGTSSC